jgi:low affinity Fe/Cu permease
MKNAYLTIEDSFEKLTSVATSLLGNSITFILAFATVLFWWINSFFHKTDAHQIIGDLILGTTFLSLFIIQKSFNHFSALLHLKINELVSSHEPANNSVMNASEKTEREIKELSLEYIETENTAIKEIIDQNRKEDQV